MSNEHGLNDQIAGEEFTDKLMAAMDSGNQAEIDRIMRESEGKELIFKDGPQQEDTPLPKPEIPADEDQTDESEDDKASDKNAEVLEDKSAAKPTDTQDDAELTPEQLLKQLELEKNRAKLFEHRARSDAGRVSALQRRIDELTSQLEKAKPQEDKTPPAAQNQKVEQLNQKIARLKEVDPELAEILADMSTGLGETPKLTTEEKQRLEQLEKVVAEFEGQREEELLRAEWNALVQEFPQAGEAMRSTEWQVWKAKQTPNMRNLAESAYHKDVAIALTRFALDMAQELGIEIPEAEAGASTPDPVAEQKAKEAARLKEERDRKLKTSTPPSARQPVENLQELDGEKLFEMAFNKTLKERNLI